jgi:hypothetical protein
LDKVEPTTDHIMQFINTYNHTNIILPIVPTQNDLSFYSQIMKGTGSYNKKLLDNTNECKQAALIERDRGRKYHT